MSVLSALEGGAVGIAVGEAGATVLEPALEGPRQEAWKKKPAKLLALGQLAELVAKALNSVDDVLDDAVRQGYARDQLLAAVQLALTTPSPPDAERLYLRRAFDPLGSITRAQLEHAYAKAGIEGQYWSALTAAAELLPLSPAQLALGIVRSTVADSGLLVVTLDTSDSNVPRYPTAQLDAIAEAAAAGVDAERLRVLVGSVGLPMAVGEAARAYFRGIITKGAFNQNVLESDTRPEWAPFILDVNREILTAHDYVEGLLRGWIKDMPTLEALTAQWGMSAADTDLLFKITGRPIPVHRVTQGYARGGSYDGTIANIPPAYISSLRQSNIRPEWYQLAFLAEQYTWPSYFVLEKLTPAVISVQRCADILTYAGWEPTLALDVATYFGKGAAKPKAETAADLATQYEAGVLAPADYTTALETLGYDPASAAAKKAAVDARPLVSARTSVLGKLRSGVVGGSITAPAAIAELAKTTVDAAIAPLLVASWEHERLIEQLSSAPPPPPVP